MHQEKISTQEEVMETTWRQRKEQFQVIHNKYGERSQKDASGEDFWNILKGVLVEAIGMCFGWTKDPAKHKQAWWSNGDANNSVCEKQELW